MLLPMAMQALMAVLHYDEEMNTAFFFESIIGSVYQMMNFLLIHFVITSVGLLFVSSEISREGNEDILNNLKESVILADTETGRILFENAAAKRLNKHLMTELNISLFEN